MSVTLINSTRLATATNGVIGVNQARATVAFLLRLNGTLSQAGYNGSAFLQRTGTQGLVIRMSSVDDVAQTMVVDSAWRASNSNGLTYKPTIYPNIVYAIVMTYDKDNPSSQAVYVNGVKYQMAPTQSVALVASSTALEIGMIAAGAMSRNFTIDNLMFWNDYVVQPAEVIAIMKGNGDPRTIGTSASWRDWWKLTGTVGATPVLGDNGLKGEITNDFPFTPTISGTVAGSGINYDAPLQFVSQATYSTTVVASSGRSIRVLTKSIAGNDLLVSKIGAAPPAVKINGGSPITLSRSFSTTHSGVLYYLPVGYQINPGDSVTLSAGEGFIETGLGIVPGCTDLACINKSGAPIYGDRPRNLFAGMNYTYPASADWGGYQGPCNWAFRLKINTAVETASTIRADGTLKVNRLNIPLVNTNAGTGVDLLDYTMPMGKWVLSFIPKDAGRASDVTLTSNTPGACTELTAYRNNGSVAGDRVIKVYDVVNPTYANTLKSNITASTTTFTLANTTNFANASAFGSLNPVLWLKIDDEYMEIRSFDATAKTVTVNRGVLGSTAASHATETACISSYYTQNPQMRVHITGPSSVPNYSDVVIYCPEDWTPPASPGTVTDLDTSLAAQIRPTKFVRDSMVNSQVCRFMDSGGAFTQMTEPEHMRQITDIYWGMGPKYVRDFRFTNIRPFNPSNTPYVYWHFPFTGAETYSATLGANITTAPAAGTVETITISDAASAPVLQGSKLFIGSEQMRAIDVSGTSVTVERGTQGTTPATHAAGSITVGWRLPITSTTQYQNLGMVAVDMQTDQPHGLRSGMWNGDPADLDMNPGARSNITLTSNLAAAGTSFTISAASGDWPKIVTGLYVKFGSDVMRILTSDSTTGAITVEAGPSSAHASGETGTTLCTGMLCKSVDGTKSAWSPKQASSIYFYVLGADRLLVCRTVNVPDKVMVVDGDQVWDQTAKVVSGSDNSQVHWIHPISQYPIDWTAKLTSLTPGAYHWLNIPVIASDDYVRDAAIRVRDNLPTGAGHKVVVELANETWNFFFPFFNLLPRQSALAGLGFNNMYDWWVLRTRDVVAVVKAAFAETGHDAEVLLSLPSQTGLIDRPLLRAEAFNIPVDVASTAPYYTPPYTAAIKDAFNASDDGQCVDTWIFEFECNTIAGMGNTVRNDGVKLAAHRARTGNNVKWITYEGSIATVLPNPPNGISDPTIYTNGIARNLDLCNNPTMYCAHTDMMSICQDRGIHGYCFFDHMQWPHQVAQGTGFYHEMWGLTCYHGQPGGRGDGSDGKADNRIALARPGQAGTKSPLANYGTSNVSTRLGSVLDWNQAYASQSGPPPDPGSGPGTGPGTDPGTDPKPGSGAGWGPPPGIGAIAKARRFLPPSRFR